MNNLNNDPRLKSRPLYIFDLDGTLSLPDHRRHLVEAPYIPVGDAGHVHAIHDGANPYRYKTIDGIVHERDPKFKPDWDQFYKMCAVDAPNWPVIGILLQLYQIGSDIQIWSGREESVRDLTVEWLYSHGTLAPYVSNGMLKNMRPTGDTTPDHVLKRKWLHAMPKEDRARLAGVFDDRDKVVAMWREEGLTCFQVAPGAF